ncbi:MAG: hypothetical protein IJF04_00025 [Oscillospiraceae bacterium]|nr:hypothetical protein [Oscillospiraceae bacterium]
MLQILMEFLSVDFAGQYKIINLKAVYQQFFVLQVVFKVGTSPCFMAKQQVLAMSKGRPGVAARKRPHCLKGAGFFNRLRLKKTGGFFYNYRYFLMNPLATSWPSLLAADGRPLCFASLNISPNRGVSFDKGRIAFRVICLRRERSPALL